MSNIFVAMRLLIISIFLFTLGCSTTRQASEVTRSGFLGDYSKLKPGKDGQALLVYKNPLAAWGLYSKIIIEPVSVYMTKDAQLRSDSKEELKELANYFYSSLHEELKKSFKIVKTPGEDVLRLRVALTDGDQSEVLLDTISTVMPIGLALSAIKRNTYSDSDTAVGFAQAEADVRDSVDGTRLAAAVDKQYGSKALRSKFGSWNHAKEAMDHWAAQIKGRLVQWGAGKI